MARKSKASTAITRREIESRLRLWLRVFGMRGWEIDVVIHRKPEDCEKEYRELAGHTWVDDGYSQATVAINAYNVKRPQIPWLVAHEFVHIVLWRLSVAAGSKAGGLRPVVDATEEETVELIAQALVRLVKKRRRRR